MKTIGMTGLLLLLAVAQIAYGQEKNFGIWTDVTLKKKLTKGMNAFVEGGYRTRDGVSTTERWSVAAGMDYRIFRFLKTEVGYTYIRCHHPAETTKKGNIIPAYRSSRHRVNLSVSGEYAWKRFRFSLRERWQYTYRHGQSVPKFDDDGVTPKADEIISGKGKNVLRSRLKAEYAIPKSRFTPYASVEFYHSGEGLEKTRWTMGTTYKINKRNALDIYYRYQNKSDEGETDGHVMGIGYTLKF